MSQSDLAERVDVSFRYIGFIECGKSYPSSEVLEAIAQNLCVPVYALFYDADTEEPNVPDVEEIKQLVKSITTDFMKTLEALQKKIERL